MGLLLFLLYKKIFINSLAPEHVSFFQNCVIFRQILVIQIGFIIFHVFIPIDGLVQERRNSSALAIEFCLSLTHWGRVTHICVSPLTIIGSDNGLSPGRRQAIFWTNAVILLIGPWGTNFSEILTEIHSFSFNEMHLKMSSGKWQPFCLDLNVLTHWYID